jgi:cell division protein FtsL
VKQARGHAASRSRLLAARWRQAAARRFTSSPTRRRLTLLCTVSVGVTGLGLLHVAEQHQIVRLGYELSQADRELHRQEEQNRRLRLELAHLTRPERIRQLAEALGLVMPSASEFRVLPGDETSAPPGGEGR